MGSQMQNPLCVAYGTLNMAGAAGTQFVGPTRGFTQANAVDNAVGDWTVALDRDTADPVAAATGGQFFAVQQVAATGGVTGPVASSIEIVTATLGTATPQIRIRVLDTAGMGADPLLTILMFRAFGT